MSISFNVSQTRQIRILTTWLGSAVGEDLETAFEAQDLLTRLDVAFDAYRRGRLPLSEVRKRHGAVCDFLADAARRHADLEGCAYAAYRIETIKVRRVVEG